MINLFISINNDNENTLKVSLVQTFVKYLTCCLLKISHAKFLNNCTVNTVPLDFWQLM